MCWRQFSLFPLIWAPKIRTWATYQRVVELHFWFFFLTECLSTLRVVYSFPKKSCLQRIWTFIKQLGAWVFHMLSHYIPETAFSWSWPEVVWSLDRVQEFGELPRLGELVAVSQSRADPSRESHFQLGTDRKYLPPKGCFRWLGAGLVVGRSQSSRRKSRGARLLWHPRPETNHPRKPWPSNAPLSQPWLQVCDEQKCQASICLHLETQKHLLFNHIRTLLPKPGAFPYSPCRIHKDHRVSHFCVRTSKFLLGAKHRESVSISCSVMFDSLQPHELQPARLLCPWDSQGKNTGEGCHFLLQGTFPT